MSNPKVSICIPTYNGAEFIAQCLESACSQTFSDIEIIVCDDGSTDDTIELVRAVMKDDARVKLHVNEKNLGLVGNWNKSIDIAQGEWIKFIFQDDYLESRCLEELLKMQRENVPLMISERSFILTDQATEIERKYYNGGVLKFSNLKYFSDNNYIPAIEISRLGAENICLNFIGEPSLSFFKKEIVQLHGAFNSSLIQICDLEFLLRMASHYGIVYVPKKLAHFRIHSKSTTSSNLDAKHFVLRHIEPVIFCWHLLYHKNFDVFRRALNRRMSVRLNRYLEVRTYESSKHAAESKVNQIAFDKMTANYPEIKEQVLARLMTKMIFQLVKLKRKIKG